MRKVTNIKRSVQDYSKLVVGGYQIDSYQLILAVVGYKCLLGTEVWYFRYSMV